MDRALPRLPGSNAEVEDWLLWADEMLDYTTHLVADAESLRAVITDVLGVPDGRIDDLEMLAMDLQRRRADHPGGGLVRGAGDHALRVAPAPRAG